MATTTVTVDVCPASWAITRYVCPMEGMTRFAPHTDTQCDDDRDGVVEENEVCYRNTQGRGAFLIFFTLFKVLESAFELFEPVFRHL